MAREPIKIYETIAFKQWKASVAECDPRDQRDNSNGGGGRRLTLLVFCLESYSRPCMVQGEGSQEEHANLAELSVWGLVSRDTARSCMAKPQEGGSCAKDELPKSAWDLLELLLSTGVRFSKTEQRQTGIRKWNNSQSSQRSENI